MFVEGQRLCCQSAILQFGSLNRDVSHLRSQRPISRCRRPSSEVALREVHKRRLHRDRRLLALVALCPFPGHRDTLGSVRNIRLTGSLEAHSNCTPVEAVAEIGSWGCI